MSDEIMEEDGIQYLREASRLIPLIDARPSSCVSLLVFNPISSKLTVTWHRGELTTLDCSREDWISFKLSLGSSGEWVNSLLSPRPAAGKRR